MKTILFIIGTRPEAIKMAPVIIYGRAFANSLDIKICLTAQHRDLLDEVLYFFDLSADYDLDLMTPGQGLGDLTANILNKIPAVYEDCKPSLVVVQGDTTTAMTAALAAFYMQIPIAHIEAGLRSHSMSEPFPEEANRKIIGQLAQWHFAPTENAMKNLTDEKILGNKIVTGNTVIDALIFAQQKIVDNAAAYAKKFSFINIGKRYLLVTVHRRENFGTPLFEICKAMQTILDTYEDVELLWPVHPNPQVKTIIEDFFAHNEKVHLLSPLKYDDMAWMMSKSNLIITDSGGIQEEAPTMGKPVIVLRNVTERGEGVEAGTAILAGNKYDSIVELVSALLKDDIKYAEMATARNPYGDGQSSQLIVEKMEAAFGKE